MSCAFVCGIWQRGRCGFTPQSFPQSQAAAQDQCKARASGFNAAFSPGCIFFAAVTVERVFDPKLFQNGHSIILKPRPLVK